MQTPLFQYQNLAAFDHGGGEYEIRRLSDQEPLWFTISIQEAIAALLNQSDVYRASCAPFQKAVTYHFQCGDLETVRTLLEASA